MQTAHDWERRAKACLQRWGIQFNNHELLREALTHPSYHNVDPKARDNQRLEFLGDAVLDLIAGEWLYHSRPDISPHKLTEYRSALVQGPQLVVFAQKLGLPSCIRVGRGAYQGKGKTMQDRILADTFEALIGALYLDQGLDAVRRFMVPLLEEAFENLLRGGGLYNYKGMLQEWAQARGLGQPRYRKVNQRGPSHAPCYEVEVLIQGKVYGRGKGRNLRLAEKDAARDALIKVNVLTEEEAPPLFTCD